MLGGDVLRLMKMVRWVGLLVVLAGGFALSAPELVLAGGQCEMYTMDDCITEESCLEAAGTECGSQLPGCGGEGTIACGIGGCGGSGHVMVCQFDDD